MYNGLILLIDDETKTYWDHITGEAVHGELKGRQLEQWGIRMTTAGSLHSECPDILLYRSQQSLKTRFIVWFMNLPFTNGWFPPGFRKTMSKVDSRLDEMCIGLGVVTDSAKQFYPKDRIRDGIDTMIDGRQLRIGISEEDATPFAVFCDDGSRPVQLFCRWYGFSLTYSDSEIYTSEM